MRVSDLQVGVILGSRVDCSIRSQPWRQTPPQDLRSIQITCLFLHEKTAEYEEGQAILFSLFLDETFNNITNISADSSDIIYQRIGLAILYEMRVCSLLCLTHRCSIHRIPIIHAIQMPCKMSL